MKVIEAFLNRIDKSVIMYERYEAPTLEEACQNPCLDDEGTYDYMAFGKPNDYNYWGRYDSLCKCDYCGKEKRIVKSACSYFYTYDGYDCFDSTLCLACFIKDYFKQIRYKVRQVKPMLNDMADVVKANNAVNKAFKEAKLSDRLNAHKQGVKWMAKRFKAIAIEYFG